MEQESRVKHLYVMYSTDTLMPTGITSVEPLLEEGLSYGRIEYSTGEDFITFKKVLHNYCVIVENGWATFRPINILTQAKRIKDSGNIVLDINPKQIFFEIIGIAYIYRKGKITLILDVDDIDADVRLFLKNMLSPDKCHPLWITDYGNPTALVTVTKFNLYELVRDKQIELDIICDRENISLWSTK